jgi:hypothetical protein
VFCKF